MVLAIDKKKIQLKNVEVHSNQKVVLVNSKISLSGEYRYPNFKQPAPATMLHLTLPAVSYFTCLSQQKQMFKANLLSSRMKNETESPL